MSQQREAAKARWARAEELPRRPARKGTAHIPERLRWARARAQLTTRGLGERAGCTGAAVSTIEASKSNPTAELLERLARPLKVSPEWLAYGAGE